MPPIATGIISAARSVLDSLTPEERAFILETHTEAARQLGMEEERRRQQQKAAKKRKFTGDPILDRHEEEANRPGPFIPDPSF